MRLPRQTLARPVSVRGVGLFTGREVSVVVRPATGGITFLRTDLPSAQPLAAVIENGSPVPVHPAFANMPARSTNLGPPTGSPLVATCEHVLSALAGLGVTDAAIELDGPELPIGDGSAAMFVEAIDAAGLVPAPGAVEPLSLTEAVRVEDGTGGEIEALPAAEPRFAYELDYGPASPIPRQSASWDGSAASYRAIAAARTFCLEGEARAMRALGLFGAFSPRDLLVFGPAGPVENAVRSENEPAQHKLLDLIGDLALLGRPLLAAVRARRSGHALNRALTLKLRGHEKQGG